jgi:tetratricopeptide (TPR) repeat protein/predicted Ser/Thr protein kinase
MARALIEKAMVKASDLFGEPFECLGRYQIVRELGHGGGGTVYLAHDPQLGRQVAVKVLDRATEALVERFNREMAILASLNHPNIVAIHDSGVEEGRPYYAMDYVDGPSLAEASLSREEAVRVIEDVARACHAAHQKGIVHRDLKPQNVLLGQRPMVADFGVARLVDVDLTQTGFTVGTPAYMSPEQVKGQPVDARSDVFSLGVMLYELLTRSRPFSGQSLPEIARRIADEEPPRPRTLAPDLPPSLEAVIERALAKQPRARYATACLLADDLAAWRTGRRVSARSAGPALRLLRFVRRRPIAALLVGAAIVGTSWSLIASWRGEPRRATSAEGSVILEESLAVERWEVNLYKPPRQISFDRLEVAVERLETALGTTGLPRELRHQGHASASRALRLIGRTEESLRHAERAISVGRGMKTGEDHFLRAGILWEEIVREGLARNKLQAERLLEEVRTDLEAGLAAGFQDEWQREFAEAWLILARDREKSLPLLMEALGKLESVPEQPTEEVARFRGDVLLLMKEPQRAIAEYQRAIRARECDVQAHNGLALAHATRDDNRDSVLAAFETAARSIDINPSYEGSYFLYVHLCRKALQGSASQLRKPNLDALELLGRAIPRLEAAGDLHPDAFAIQAACGTASVLEAFLLAAAGLDPAPSLDRAQSPLLRSTQLNNGAFEPWLALGMAELLTAERLAGPARTDALDRAETCLLQAHDRDPTNASVEQWLGHTALLDGRTVDAAACFRRSLELDPARWDELHSLIDEAESRE